VLVVKLWPQPSGPPLDDDDEEIDRLLAVTNPGFVGIKACAQCHARRVEEFKTTRHFGACKEPEDGVAAPGFQEGASRCDTRFPGLHFEMNRVGRDFLMTAVQVTAGVEKRDSYRVALVYGSASRRDEMYFAWQDGRLLRLPVAWLYPYQCWGDASDSLHIADAPVSCIDCHNTWVEHIPGNPIRYRREDMLIGVTCERCHGPGREHVEYHRSQASPTGHAILHPGSLSRERLMDVCAQCHANVRPLGKPFNYRPGEPLENYYRTIHTRHREDDTTNNQVQYLGESRCYKESSMTCVTCHSPHRPGSARAACLKCHTAASCTDAPRQPEAVRSDCVGCHMPQNLWMNSHYYATTDEDYLPVAPRSEHRIAVYPRAKQAVELAWLRKQESATAADVQQREKQLFGSWVNEAEQVQGEGRLRAAIGAFREALLVTPNPAVRAKMQKIIARQAELDSLSMKWADAGQRSTDESIDILTKILAIDPNDARAHGELGAIYAKVGRRAEAVAHLEAVARCDPGNPSGLTRLAFMADTDGHPEEAVSLCARAERIAPDDPMVHYVCGKALAKLERWSEAEKEFRRALKVNPTHSGANVGLSEALRHQGQAREAVRFARRGIRFGNSKDLEALMTLAEAYAAAGYPAEARSKFQESLAVAQVTAPSLVPSIHERLNQLR
jgi:tetratricopeptide (TPR) repeat protein